MIALNDNIHPVIIWTTNIRVVNRALVKVTRLKFKWTNYQTRKVIKKTHQRRGEVYQNCKKSHTKSHQAIQTNYQFWFPRPVVGMGCHVEVQEADHT